MSDARCGWCGKDPASGYATVNDIRFCHGDDEQSPTCYELGSREATRRMANDVGLDLPPDDVLREVLGEHADNPTVQRWVHEFRAFMRERETWYPEKDAPFWLRLGVHGDLPAHMPMAVTVNGQGPAEGDDIHHYVCWCGDVECPLTVALQHAWLRGRAVKGVAYWRLPGETV